MAETTPEQDLFKLSLNPIQDYFSIDIRQINGNGLEVERFCEKNGILEHMDATHKIDTLKHFIQCLRRLYQQSITCSQLSPFQITCLRNQLSVSDKSKRTNDIHSLANIYCSVLTNEKWQNYSEELPIEDIQCSNPDLGLDILRVMTEGNDSTTNTKEVFLHPFYWSDAKKVDFLCNATIYISSKIPAVRRGYGMDMVLKQFNMYEVEYVIPEFGWIECLRLTIDEQKANKIENDVISKLARKFKNNTVYELLRFFRIHSVHRHNDENDVKAVFGDYPAGYLGFFTSRFPKFFMHVYWNMKIYLEGDTKLERYFMDDLTTLDKSFNSEAEGGLDLLSRNQRWTPIAEGIKYDQESCYREGYKVFDAIRKSAGVEEKIVVKFVPDNTANKREIGCLWATIGHENVVKYLQSGYCKFKNEKFIFIAMEKCDEDTLFEKIQAENWSYDVRKSTVYCIAKGLQHLKEKGILHRDLKPQNILFRGDVPVISDFGVSRRILPNKSHTHQSVMHVGTGGWRAPETSMEGGWCSFAGDVYAAGLVNFFALTNGKHPFGEDLFGRQYLINNYPDNRYKMKGMERNLKALEKIGVLDCTIAHDMIDLMLSPNPKHRPTVEAVLENPFFWTLEKRLKFFTDTHKCIEHNISLLSEIIKFFSELNKGERKYERQIQDEMENLEENWKDKLPFTDDEMQIIQTNFTQQKFRVEVYKDAMVRKAKKYGDSVTELLRFIRNRYTHINEDKKEGTINQSEEQFLKYFSDRFPHLFLYIYSKITDNNPSQSEITIFSELNRREGKYGSQIQDEMKNWKEKLPFTDDEMRMIQANFAQQSVRAVVDINAVTRKAKKYKDSVTELLRFIRNRYMHINDDKKEGTINQSEDQILKYYFDRFPHLFVYVYGKIKDNYYGKTKSKNCCTDMAKYFPLLQPKIIRNEVNNESLEIEWEPVIRANSYKLEIYTNNSRQKEPVLTKDVGEETEWTQAFDDKFGYGTSYYAVVTAVGDKNKRSSTSTGKKQIGGDEG